MALDKNKRNQNPAHTMHMLKESRKRSTKAPDVLAIPYTGEKASEMILEQDVPRFEIVGIEVKGVPGVRVINQPISPPGPPPRRPKPRTPKPPKPPKPKA
jgi:hypothetical protein